jgi:serine/threonine protein kinase
MVKHGGREGEQLGNYQLTRLLGHGGFAEVYLGEHLYLKRPAALKVLRTSLDDEGVARFLVEAQTLARLTHPQIVRVHDFAVEQGTPFLVMDYAPRGTLRRHHPYGSCLSLDTVVAYVRQIATALQYAHNRNMIHRDVKPENILLGAQREVLLSDFGLALFAPSPEQLSTQEMAGTLPYMAPEQLRGKPCFASDQYALAIVVYEWLCGVRPFEGSHWQLVNQHVSALPPPLREKDPSLPEAVESVVLKALAKDPEQRYVSIQLFAQALERASRAGVNVLRNDSEVTGALPAISPAPPVTSRGIFLSGSHNDVSFVARLQTDLQKRGVAIWNEHHGSTPDTLDQEDRLRQAIRAVDVVVLVVSSHTRSSHIVREHLRIVATYQRQLIYIWAEGEDLAKLLPEVGEKTPSIDVIDARETRYKLALDELVACLEEETGVSAPLEPLPVENAHEPRNPYKGLRAFTEDDTADFFGREALIGELVDGVKEVLKSEQSDASTARLLAVVGPSGSGKSSVVMAGLFPRLQQGALAGSEEWVYLKPMVPGVSPLERLALTLAPHLPDRSLRNILEDLEDDSARGLHWLSTHLVQGSEKKVVLFIDQFEEVFNLTTSENERERFFHLVLAAITEQKGPVMVILTLRADFYDRLMVFSELGRLIQKHQLLVWPMEVDELRAAIKGPATLPDVLLTFEGNLVGDLLYEVRGQVGALPLLEFTLDQLFIHRNGQQLTLQAYHDIGGVKGALTKHAENTYAALATEEHRKLVRVLFLRLIDPGTSEQDTTRRRAALSEFSLADARQTDILRETVDAFIAARLLTANTTADMTTIEVSHEALIREWPRLADWLATSRSDILLQGDLSTDVAEWLRRERPTDRLYHGSQLVEALAWARRNEPSKDEVAFLQASEADRERRETAERERKARELELQRRAAVRQRYVIGLMGVTSIIVVVALIVGLVLQTQLLNSQTQLLNSLPASVTNLNDSGSGSLRDAIQHADPGSTITFAKNLRGTIFLTHGQLELSKNITLSGPSNNNITVDAKHMSRIFQIDKDVTAVISNLTVMNGFAKHNESASSSQGGGIYTDDEGGGIYADENSTLVLIGSQIIHNSAFFGGDGIYSYGQLSISNSVIASNSNYFRITGNTAQEINVIPLSAHQPFGNLGVAARGTSGGSIVSEVALSISHSTIENNTASGVGGVGGILSYGSLTLTDSKVLSNGGELSGGIFTAGDSSISNCIISGNKGVEDVGGLISFARIFIESSAITNNISTNSSFYGGGGIRNEGDLSLGNSTISGNKTASNGGGISNHGSVSITYGTIYNNSAMKGGGIANEEEWRYPGDERRKPTYTISTSIIAGNQAADSPDIAGSVTLSYPNLIENSSGAIISFDERSDPSIDQLTRQLITGEAPQLAPLSTDASHPDAPPTHALLPGSPAIDQVPRGDNCSSRYGYGNIDERGVSRPQGKGCDLGAYEYVPVT